MATHLPRLAVACCALLVRAPLQAQETSPPADDPAWIDVVWPGEADPSAGDFLRVGAQLGFEFTHWGSNNDKHDGVETEALSLLLSGRVGEATFLVDLDADGEETRHNLKEAWLEGPLGARHWIRAGWQRFALGSEFATREEDLPLVGYAFPSWENGRRGPGVSVDGYPAGWLWWQAGASLAAGSDLTGERLGDEQLNLRLVFAPEPGPDGGFEGVFGGVALAQSNDLDGPLNVETPLDQTVFTTPGLDGDARSALAFELGFRSGSFRGGVETSDGKLSDVELPGGGEQTFDEVGAWAACSYVLRLDQRF